MRPVIFVPDMRAEISEREGSGAACKNRCRQKENLLPGVQKELPHSGGGRHAEAAAGLGHAVDQPTEGSKCAAQITVLCFLPEGTVMVCATGICACILLDLGACGAAVRAEIGFGTPVRGSTRGATVHFLTFFTIDSGDEATPPGPV